jgi:hypothetical protein
MNAQSTRRASAADATTKTNLLNSSLRSLFHRSLSVGAESLPLDTITAESLPLDTIAADQESVSTTTATPTPRWIKAAAAATTAATTPTTTKKAEIAATKIQSLSPSIYNDEQMSMMMQRSNNSFRGGGRGGRGGGMYRMGSSTRLIGGKVLPPHPPSHTFIVNSNEEDDDNANHDDDEDEEEEDVDFTDLLQKVKLAQTAVNRWKGMVTKKSFERSNDDDNESVIDNMLINKNTHVNEVQSNSPSMDNDYTNDDEVTRKSLSSHVISSMMTESKLLPSIDGDGMTSKHSNGDEVVSARCMSEVMTPSENNDDAPILYASTIELAELRLMKAMKRVDNVSECTPKQEISSAKKELFDAKAHLETLRLMIKNTLYTGTTGTGGTITDIPSLQHVETVKPKLYGRNIQSNITNDTHSSSGCKLVNEFSDNELIDDTGSINDEYTTDNDYSSTDEYRLSVIEEIESMESVDTPDTDDDDESLCTRDDNDLVVFATTECNAIDNAYEEDVSAQAVVKNETLDKTDMSLHQQRSTSTCSETLSPSPELKPNISSYSTTTDVLRIFDELCSISTTNSHTQESNDPHLLMSMGISTDLESKWLVTSYSSERESRVLHTQHTHKHTQQ